VHPMALNENLSPREHNIFMFQWLQQDSNNNCLFCNSLLSYSINIVSYNNLRCQWIVMDKSLKMFNYNYF
jgi:hypothetical protein